ncbi:MAG: hypothetical protein JO224_03600 [Pelomonas sp.]|nr:hypothetical protein [Roseateles sp.]
MPSLSLPPPAVLQPLGAGTPLGVWRLREALHTGPAGQWYRAVHAMAAGHSAVLLLLPRNARSGAALLRYAEQAGEIGPLLDAGGGIAVPCDSGVTPGGQAYLVLSQAEGRPIDLVASSLPLRARLELVLTLCERLQVAHEAGWLLGEVDPEAIWVTSEGALTLMGLALQRSSVATPHVGLNITDLPPERAAWLAPEQIAGAAPSLATEAYGVGTLLYLLVEGQLPSAVVDEPTGQSWPELSPIARLSLDALLRKAVAPQGERRHTSVRTLADDLRAWLAGDSHSALRITPMPLPADALAVRRGSRWTNWLRGRAA